MTNPAGSFIWYELMTPDPDAVAPFYAAVVGWTLSPANPAQAGGMDYRMVARLDGKSAGGVLRLSTDMLQHGARPLWVGYLSSPDVDRQVASIVADGGRVQMPATNLPVGRIAMVTDPQGVPTTVVLSSTSLPRHCAASPSPSMAMEARPVHSAMWLISCAASSP